MEGRAASGVEEFKELGIELTPDEPARPARVMMSRIGAMMQAVETPVDRDIQAAEALGCSVDRELRKKEKLEN